MNPDFPCTRSARKLLVRGLISTAFSQRDKDSNRVDINLQENAHVPDYLLGFLLQVMQASEQLLPCHLGLERKDHRFSKNDGLLLSLCNMQTPQLCSWRWISCCSVADKAIWINSMSDCILEEFDCGNVCKNSLTENGVFFFFIHFHFSSRMAKEYGGLGGDGFFLRAVGRLRIDITFAGSSLCIR
jgi:hypothetical protein